MRLSSEELPRVSPCSLFIDIFVLHFSCLTFGILCFVRVVNYIILKSLLKLDLVIVSFNLFPSETTSTPTSCCQLSPTRTTRMMTCRRLSPPRPQTETPDMACPMILRNPAVRMTVAYISQPMVTIEARSSHKGTTTITITTTTTTTTTTIIACPMLTATTFSTISTTTTTTKVVPR